MTSRTEWTAAQLVAEAERRELPLSRRQVIDWVEKGLLDKPRRRGRGRGSAPAVWSEHQAEMLWAVLAQHQTVNRIGRLADIPVGAFLGWGEEYASVSQVRRAVRTWAGANTATSLRRLRHTAGLLVADLNHSRTPKALREQLLDQLLAVNADGFANHADDLRATLRKIIGAQSDELVLPKAEDYLTGLEARLAGVAPFLNRKDPSEFPDAVLRRAAVLYRQTQSDYLAQSGTPIEQMHRQLFDNACLRLIMLLGIHALATEKNQ